MGSTAATARSVACVLLLSLAPALSGTAQGGSRQRQASRPEIAGKVETLREFVGRFARRKVNTFYIARAKNDDGKEYLYAYWKEDDSILLFEHFDVDPYDGDATYSWLHDKARINLATDVVPTSEAVGGSTYLVARPWVNRIIRACREGEKLIIRKPARAASRRGRE